MQAARKLDPLLLKKANGLHRAAGTFEGIEYQADGALYLRVGIKVDNPVGSIDEADRRAHLKLAPARLVELAATHAGLEHMQLGLTHGALEPQQQSVIEVGGIVDAVFVEDQGRGERAEFNEPVPVG